MITLKTLLIILEINRNIKKDLNELKEIRNVEIIKYKKHTPGHKKLLNLFNDLLDITLTDKTLESESQEYEDKNENEKENENENDKNKNAKNKKSSTNTKNEDENKNILLEYIGEIDDKLFKKYSNGKDFNSSINEFDRATNEKDKEKVVKELKGIHNLVDNDIETDENSEYINELIDIGTAITFFLYEYSKK